MDTLAVPAPEPDVLSADVSRSYALLRARHAEQVAAARERDRRTVLRLLATCREAGSPGWARSCRRSAAQIDHIGKKSAGGV